ATSRTFARHLAAQWQRAIAGNRRADGWVGNPQLRASNRNRLSTADRRWHDHRRRHDDSRAGSTDRVGHATPKDEPWLLASLALRRVESRSTREYSKQTRRSAPTRFHHPSVAQIAAAGVSFWLPSLLNVAPH